eukprot:9494027-Pyramimonas_sp.AAC.1
MRNSMRMSAHSVDNGLGLGGVGTSMRRAADPWQRTAVQSKYDGGCACPDPVSCAFASSWDNVWLS